jgi:large subunit ribosomal protein L13
VRTYTPKPGEVTRSWYVIDATDVVLGRLASQTAVLLRGKHKPTFAPHVDTGDFVIIINADKVALTGKAQRRWPTATPASRAACARPRTPSCSRRTRKAVEKAVRGMLPKNSLARQQLSKLKVYAGDTIPTRRRSPCPSRSRRSPSNPPGC